MLYGFFFVDRSVIVPDIYTLFYLQKSNKNKLPLPSLLIFIISQSAVDNKIVTKIMKEVGKNNERKRWCLLGFLTDDCDSSCLVDEYIQLLISLSNGIGVIYPCHSISSGSLHWDS